MAIIKHSNKEKDLLARLMRSEALGDGDLGMLMVGNVIVNRTIANCLTFKSLRTINDVIFQKNQFYGTKSSLFSGKAYPNLSAILVICCKLLYFNGFSISEMKV